MKNLIQRGREHDLQAQKVSSTAELERPSLLVLLRRPALFYTQEADFAIRESTSFEESSREIPSPSFKTALRIQSFASLL